MTNDELKCDVLFSSSPLRPKYAPWFVFLISKVLSVVWTYAAHYVGPSVPPPSAGPSASTTTDTDLTTLATSFLERVDKAKKREACSRDLKILESAELRRFQNR